MTSGGSTDVGTGPTVAPAQVVASFALVTDPGAWIGLDSPVVIGWVKDCGDGIAYPFGTCADGYFLFDCNGWGAWPDAAGLMRGLHYALTGRALHG